MCLVGDLLTERAVLGVIATLAVLGLFVMLCRARRVSTSVEDAVMDMLDRMSKASSDLRAGLTQEAADKATPDFARKDYQVGLLVLFDDFAGLEAYLKHDLHQKYVDKHLKHIDETRLQVYDFINPKK